MTNSNTSPATIENEMTDGLDELKGLFSDFDAIAEKYGDDGLDELKGLFSDFDAIAEKYGDDD